ncbi:MAG: hypothetical protein WD607_08290 [Candidatus Paceibacterota bacterium]
MEKGKLIVLYGINNLGKTTQAKLILEKILENNKKAEYIKYPMYDFSTAGPVINKYLREGNPYNLSPREFQILNVLNRTQYQSVLKEKLSSGINIIAEDYTGTGIAWGIGAGVNESFLLELNKDLIKEDLSILMDGKRFLEGKESGHTHEEDDELTKKVREAHLKLSKSFDWEVINANRDIDTVHKEVWEKVSKILY